MVKKGYKNKDILSRKKVTPSPKEYKPTATQTLLVNQIRMILKRNRLKIGEFAIKAGLRGKGQGKADTFEKTIGNRRRMNTDHLDLIINQLRAEGIDVKLSLLDVKKEVDMIPNERHWYMRQIDEKDQLIKELRAKLKKYENPHAGDGEAP